MPPVIDHLHRSVGRHRDQGDTEAVLVAALGISQDRGRLVVIPSAPVIPGDEDGGLVARGVGAPVVTLVAALRPTISDGIYDRRHPCWAAASVTAGVVRVLAGWSDPGDRLQATAGDGGQRIAQIGIVDIVSEVD